MNKAGKKITKISQYILNTALFASLVYVTSMIPWFSKQNYTNSSVNINTAHADYGTGYNPTGSDADCDGADGGDGGDCE